MARFVMSAQAPTPRPAASKFSPTAEQQAALKAFRTGGSLVIEAGAGSGKTSTLRLLGEDRPGRRGLYLAYNKSIRIDAEKSFPSNVTCKTAHSLAYASHGRRLRHRLSPRRNPGWEVANILDTEALAVGEARITATGVANLAMDAVERFCRTDAETVTLDHVVPPSGLEDARPGPLRMLADVVLGFAQTAWRDLCREHGQLKVSHDHYLKQWALTRPILGYDFILFDEAQDADPCIAGVVAGQTNSSQVVMVGDAAQAIYGWRGAIDALSKAEVDHRTRLTQSFRFGNRIAAEANTWLQVIGTDMRLTGNPAKRSVLAELPYPSAILCRTNAMAVREVMKAHGDRVRVHLVGGGLDIRRIAKAAMQLKAGKKVGDSDLAAFSSWEELRDYARKDPSGSDLATAVSLVDEHGAKRVLTAIEMCTEKEDAAELVISTAHKAKGREWSSVRIATDFKEPPADEKTGARIVPREDAMLAYVSVTRAMNELDNEGLAWISQLPR